MSLPWFRLYHEIKDDPKMGLLDDFSFRVFIESLCWACEKGDNGNTGLTEETANWAFRRNVTETLLKLFQCKLLIKNKEGFIVVTKWEERQKISDVSTQRVRDFRNRTKKEHETVSETLLKRNETVQEENRIEKEEITIPEKLLSNLEFNETWQKWQKFRKKKKACKDWNGLWRNQLDLMVEWGADWAVQTMKASMANDWQGIFPPKNGQAIKKIQSKNYNNI